MLSFSSGQTIICLTTTLIASISPCDELVNLWCLLSFSIVMSRGETGELRVGVRRAMRQLSNVPSSVISSHSMHIGVLATAWHAVSTGTMFTVYYKPRCVVVLYSALTCYVYLLVAFNFVHTCFCV